MNIFFSSQGPEAEFPRVETLTYLQLYSVSCSNFYHLPSTMFSDAFKKGRTVSSYAEAVFLRKMTISCLKEKLTPPAFVFVANFYPTEFATLTDLELNIYFSGMRRRGEILKSSIFLIYNHCTFMLCFAIFDLQNKTIMIIGNFKKLFITFIWCMNRNIVIFRCFLFRHLDLLKHFDIILANSRLKQSSFRPRKTFRFNKTKYANLH